MRAFLDRLKATEPARLAEFVRTVLAALVAVGWLTINDGLINTIASLAALGFSALLTRFVRNRVTPVATQIED